MNEKQTERRDDRPPKIFWLLLPLGIALAAFITAKIVFLVYPYDWPVFILAAPLSALVVGIPAWYQFIVLPRRATIRHGIMVGAIGSIIVHPVMWMFVYLSAMQRVFGARGTSPMEWAFLSLFYTGCITTPFGALAGGLLVYLQRAVTSVAQTRINQRAEAMRQREMQN